VIGGGIKGIDVDTTRTVVLHGSVLRGAARVEHGIAVAVVDGRLTRLDLVRGTTETLKVDGRWIGGPSAGRIFVERDDGVYVRSLAPDAHQFRVARYTGQARTVAASGPHGIIGMEDSRIFVVDLVHARTSSPWTRRAPHTKASLRATNDARPLRRPRSRVEARCVQTVWLAAGVRETRVSRFCRSRGRPRLRCR
jgi:hypothetical protein